MKQITKESDAWFLLAETFDLYASSWDYLCCWIDSDSTDTHESAFARSVAPVTRAAMKTRIIVDMDATEEDIGYRAAYSDGYDAELPGDREAAWADNKKSRVLACLMFGWEAKSEGR